MFRPRILMLKRSWRNPIKKFSSCYLPQILVVHPSLANQALVLLIISDADREGEHEETEKVKTV